MMERPRKKKNSEWSSTVRKYLSTFGSRRLSSIVWGAEFFRARSFPSRILCYVLLRHSIRALERRQQRERRKIKFLEFLLSFMFRLLGLCCNTTELNKSGLDFFFPIPKSRTQKRSCTKLTYSRMKLSCLGHGMNAWIEILIICSNKFRKFSRRHHHIDLVTSRSKLS